jgi:phosphohistidine phosphatase SixA
MQVKEMGAWLVREIGRVDLVVTSPFARAVDTAKPMAEMLGCEIVEMCPALDPDGDPRTAWSDIEILTRVLHPEPHHAHVLIVAHHPLINALAEYVCGCSTDEEHWLHAAIMHAHGKAPAAKLEYFVSPKLIERECPPDLLEALADVTEGVVSLAESLKHQKHAEVLEPIRGKAKAFMERMFRKQGRAVLKALKPGIRALTEADADDDAKAKARLLVTRADSVLALPIAQAQGASWDKLLSEAIRAAVTQMAGELALEGITISDDAMERYLRQNSLTNLSGGFADTTVQRLRDAIADAYAAGGGYSEVVDAAKQVFSDFTNVRAGLIAQTEMNDAYNAGRGMLARAAGFGEKAWSCDGPAPCPECLANAAEGWIGIEETFLSGDDEPTAHPGCYCSLDFRKS